MQVERNPDDEIRIGVLCAAQNYKGLCRVTSGLCTRGYCSLSGAPIAMFCKIPASHPVSQYQREMFVRDPAAALN